MAWRDYLDKKITDYKPLQRNPNKGTQRGSGILDQSVRELGAGRSLLVDKNGIILAGNHAQEAFINAGLENVIEVESDGNSIIVVKRTDMDANSTAGKKMAIMDNRTSEQGLAWDAVVLEELMSEIQEDDGALDQALEKLAKDAGIDLQKDMVEAPEAELDKAEELRVKWGVESGQLWQLGEHRLICGDCTDKAVVDRLMDGEKASFCFTDPPYGVKYTGGTKKWEMLENDDEINMYAAALPLIFEFTEDRAALYLCFASSKSLSVYTALKNTNYEQRVLIIWNKNHAQFGAMGSQYKQKHEPIAYLYKHGMAPYWFGPNNEVTVWDISREAANEFHPTQKPPELYERAINNSAPKDCIVYEPFLGSGTSIVACERLNRKCRAVEISPGYCAVSIERWHQMTGKDPILLD